MAAPQLSGAQVAAVALREAQGYAPSREVPEPMDLERVRSIVAEEIQAASTWTGGQISKDRETSRDFYLGKNIAPEVEGFSKFHSKDVLKAVEWVKPPLMRMFTSGEYLGRYEPYYNKSEPYEICEKRAEQATDEVHRRWVASNGFMVLLTAINDTLIEKTGYVKVCSDRKVCQEERTFYDIDLVTAIDLLDDPNVVPIAVDQKQVDTGLRGPMGEVIPETLFTITAVKLETDTQLSYLNVPPEHLLHRRGWPRVDESIPFIADRCRMTKSDLLKFDGVDPDLIFQLPKGQSIEWQGAHADRYRDESPLPSAGMDREDIASQEVWVTDCYILLDEDGDGYSERRRILCAGDGSSIVILLDEKVTGHPYCWFSAIPLAHKIDGLSMADLVNDLTVFRTELIRGISDFVWQQLSPPTEVLEGHVNIDDMLNRRAGSIIRTDMPDAIKPHFPANMPSGVFELVASLDGEIEARTGVSRASQMMDLSAGKNQTAGGIFELMNAAAMRVDLIARIFAETGIKDIFAKSLRALIEHPPIAQIRRIRGEYVPVDPSEWDPKMEVKIDVTIGAGQSGQRIESLKSIVEWQAKLRFEYGLANIVPDELLHNGMVALTREAGFPYPEKFFMDPRLAPPPPPPPPDPKLIEELSQAQKRVADTALDQAQLMIDAQEGDRTSMAAVISAQAQLISAMANAKNAGKKPAAKGK